ncbi:MAG TPA: hypothetical protein VJA19_07475 [Pseudomonas sp.]|nr:hypothetical protein [Pseudomonas sp.]
MESLMSKIRTLGGIVVSVAYLVWLVSIIWPNYGDIKGLDLNELGDFFAGIFGPLAFLWLVLGYFQQSDELKQGTAALLMQAKELNESVKQQEKLTQVSKAQFDLQKSALDDEKVKFERSMLSVIKCTAKAVSSGSDGLGVSFLFRNFGHKAEEFVAILETPSRTERLVEESAIVDGAQYGQTVIINGTDHVFLRLSYIDGLSLRQVEDFSVVFTAAPPNLPKISFVRKD